MAFKTSRAFQGFSSPSGRLEFRDEEEDRKGLGFQRFK